MKLTQALATLDPDNDDHWTADGLPLVHIVATAVQNQDITRQQITEAAPDFTRDTWRKQKADMVDAQASTGDELKTPAAPEPDEPEKVVAADLAMEILDGMSDVEKADVYDRQSLAKAEEIVQARKDVETTKAAVLSLTREHDQMVFLRERHKPSPTDAQATRAYITNQNALRSEKVALRDEVLKGLKPEDLMRGSPLDEAHKRRNKRGTKRPERTRLASTG